MDFSSQFNKLVTNSPTLFADDVSLCESVNVSDSADGESSKLEPPIKQSPMSSMREYLRFGIFDVFF
jgi:hypothetical protein